MARLGLPRLVVAIIDSEYLDGVAQQAGLLTQLGNGATEFLH